MRVCNLKKLISLILSLTMVLSICFAAIPAEVKAAGDVQFTVSADKQDLHRGDQVTVTVDLSGNTEAYGLTYELFYDESKLQVVGEPQAGTIFSGLNPMKFEFGSCNLAESNSVMATLIRTEAPVANGSVMAITFQVLDDATASEVVFNYNIMVSTEKATAMSYNNEDNTTGMKVVIPATGISLDKSALNVAKGQTEQLTATLSPAGSNSTVTWSSSDESIVTVDQTGLVTAVAAGKATVTATAEGKSASCEVAVTIPLNGISITGTATAIKKGQTAQLSVVYDPEDTTDAKAVIWTSSDEAVAVVDQNGIVTAIADGTAVITATVGDKTATYEITVQEIKLVSIGVKESTTIHRGQSEILEVTYDPENTTESKTVTWESSDTSKVTVDGSGKVTAVGIGGADVTARVGNYTATCHVTVDAPLESIIPAKSSIDMVKNQTAVITYTLNPADTTDSKDVTFSSSNEAVVEVNAATGELTAKAAGSATITLTGVNGIAASVVVNVTEIPIDAVVLNTQNAVVEKGETVELTATVGPEDTTDDDKTITWTSSNESIVTVAPAVSNSAETVTVTATDKGGKATITATAWNGTKAECEIIVPIHIEGISVPTAKTLVRGETIVLEVTYDPENTTDDKAVTWTSDNESVATVNAETGVITALREGTANITATTAKTTVPYTATTVITVKENHLDENLGGQITFADMQDPILKGQVADMNGLLNLAGIISDNQVTDDITIEWSSSDEEVASVDQSGAVLGVGEGEAEITAVVRATNGNGEVVGEYTATTTVRVKEIPLESITFDRVITEMQVGATATLGIIYNPENTTDLRDVEWSSSDDSIITVENGKLTALKAGEAEITAKVGDKSVSCTITVKEVQSGKNDNANTDTNSKTTNKEKGIKTGDTANVAFYIVLLLISMATVLIFWRKRIIR